MVNDTRPCSIRIEIDEDDQWDIFINDKKVYMPKRFVIDLNHDGNECNSYTLERYAILPEYDER